MKRIASMVSLLVLVAPSACKKKQDAPAPAASVSTPASAPSAAALPGAIGSAPAVSGFEGEIALLVRGKLSGSEGTPINLTLLLKNGRSRVELPESLGKSLSGLGQAHLLALPADKKAYLILDAKKQAVLLDFDKLAEQAKAFAPPAGGAPAPVPARLDKTGKSDTVAGMQCEIWHYSQGKTAGDACIAEQEVSWFPVPIGALPEEISWLSPIVDGKHLPLRFVATEQGAERGRIEVASIQKKPLAESQFELPADYTVLSFEQMLGPMLGSFGALPGSQLPPGFKLPPGIKLPPASTKAPRK